MRRWLKVALALLALIVVLLVLNAIAVSNETKGAEVTVDGGQILQTSSGEIQVLDEGDPRGSPVVLIHGYAASLRWWDRVAPLLADDHRVIRLDLLGHGGSAKPSSGYAIEDQAAAVAEALAQLDVSGATVVGHSLGPDIATALAEQSPDLVSRLVNLDEAPNDEDYGDFPFVARLAYVPVIGQAMQRGVEVAPVSLVRDQYQDVFAPDYEIASGFEDPDQLVEDLRDMTYTAFEETREGASSYLEETPLDERLATTGVPLLVVFGTEDQIYDVEESLDAYRDVLGVRIETVEGAGHSPHVEKPEEVAALILDFIEPRAREASQPSRGKRQKGKG